ncbi:hypothetical protein I4U23_015049 [Adineta vaga]|nr:hypothetical protein I4U23_015049 [Adineta vaga]
MYDEEERRRYGDSKRLEPIVEQQDDEMITTPTSSSSVGTNFLDDERRARDEIRQFEELEKELTTTRHGIRVKFDDDRFPSSSSSKTTIVKTEPCFQVNSCEDQITKHFYENEYQLKDEKNNQSLSKTPSEPDSLDEEYLIAFEEPLRNQTNDRNISSPTKSILKKTSTKDTISIPHSRSRSPSPSPSSPLKKKSNDYQSNQVQYLAGVTAKQPVHSYSSSHRSLFEPTINIFDSSNVNTRRPSRLRYYIKPYRGDIYIPPNLNKSQSRSLSGQRFSQQTEPTVWHTFSNQYRRPMNRRQHVSWSPVREYIHQGREKSFKPSTKKKEMIPSPLSTRSSSNPCLRTSSSMIPISVRYRTLFHPSSSSSIDSYETSSMTNHSLTPTSQYEEIRYPSHSSDIEHNNKLQRYDRLLEKMRATDEQLQRLSRSWTNNTTVKVPNQSNLILNKSTKKKEFISPMILQMCLIILVFFNLLVVYYFNEINIFWNRFSSHSTQNEQLDDDETNIFS